jgi:Protein of unknown function (DUF1376)
VGDDWYKRDTGEWLKIQSALSLEQVGALTVLTDTMHKLNAPLVDDDRRVAGLLGIDTRKWQAIRRRLLEVQPLKLLEVVSKPPP